MEVVWLGIPRFHLKKVPADCQKHIALTLSSLKAIGVLLTTKDSVGPLDAMQQNVWEVLTFNRLYVILQMGLSPCNKCM